MYIFNDGKQQQKMELKMTTLLDVIYEVAAQKNCAINDGATTWFPACLIDEWGQSEEGQKELYYEACWNKRTNRITVFGEDGYEVPNLTLWVDKGHFDENCPHGTFIKDE